VLLAAFSEPAAVGGLVAALVTVLGYMLRQLTAGTGRLDKASRVLADERLAELNRVEARYLRDRELWAVERKRMQDRIDELEER
jgi:hypothetical protein